VAKIFLSPTVCHKVPEGSALIFGDIQIPLQSNVGQARRSLKAKNELDALATLVFTGL